MKTSYKNHRYRSQYRISRVLNSKPVVILISICFGLYLFLSMIFWDQNSFKVHLKISQELDKLTEEKQYYESKIEECNRAARDIKNPEYLREWLYNKYLMTQPGQKIIISRMQ